LTLSIAKILESIVKDNIIHHMFNNDLIGPNQHGFTFQKSCITQLLTAIEYWTQSLDSGTSTDVIYLDISKAFDSVPHIRLLSKLKALMTLSFFVLYIQTKMCYNYNVISIPYVSGHPSGNCYLTILNVHF